jgi:hypothetical protein
MIPSTDVRPLVDGERGNKRGREAPSTVEGERQREREAYPDPVELGRYPDPAAAWNAVSSECPLRLIDLLHEYGHYLHYNDPKHPGKVICLRHDCEVPDHFHLTVAQERAYRHTAIAEKLRGEAETVVDDPGIK